MPTPLEIVRQVWSFSVIAIFLTYILFRGIAWNNEQLALEVRLQAEQATGKKPDFSQYVFNGTLGEGELPLGAGHRAILIGDVHGQSYALRDLLDEVGFDEQKDTVVHTGDIVSKGTLAGSRAVLEFMTAHNISGVRGNHDQKVIEWRAWIEWVRPMENGAGGRWLDKLEDEYNSKAVKEEEGNDGEFDEQEIEGWIETMKSKGKKKDKRWWDLVPRGWNLLGDHYQVARTMTPEQYTYLTKLPLTLHLPSEHTFVVHAGLLPYDLTRPMDAHGQPLGHAPDSEVGDLAARRAVQEREILSDVPQNKDPFVVLNMRNVLHDHSISKDTKRGKPWSGVWNTIIPKCAGFDPPAVHDVSHDKWMPCEPVTVIYGHAASRGLDIHRWTIGLDSGCVYGRRLTALVLDKPHEHRKKLLRSDEDKEAQEDAKAQAKGAVDFGDEGAGRLVSVKCHKHKEKKGAGKLPE